MGFWKTAAKIVFFPVYLPYKLSTTAVKKIIPQEYPIEAVVTTKYPMPYVYYFESLGHKTELIGDNVIVWRRGIGEKEKREVLAKLQTKLQQVI